MAVTRQEQIEDASQNADETLDGNRQLDLSLINAFKSGAEWADENPQHFSLGLLRETQRMLAIANAQILVAEEALNNLNHLNNHTIDEEKWRIEEALAKIAKLKK